MPIYNVTVTMAIEFTCEAPDEEALRAAMNGEDWGDWDAPDWEVDSIYAATMGDESDMVIHDGCLINRSDLPKPPMLIEANGAEWMEGFTFVPNLGISHVGKDVWNGIIDGVMHKIWTDGNRLIAGPTDDDSETDGKPSEPIRNLIRDHKGTTERTPRATLLSHLSGNKKNDRGESPVDFGGTIVNAKLMLPIVERLDGDTVIMTIGASSLDPIVMRGLTRIGVISPMRYVKALSVYKFDT